MDRVFGIPSSGNTPLATLPHLLGIVLESRILAFELTTPTLVAHALQAEHHHLRRVIQLLFSETILIVLVHFLITPGHWGWVIFLIF